MKRTPTLDAAMRLSSPRGNGLCFHLSVALCADWPSSIVVIGVLADGPSRGITEPDASPCPFYHCWVEYKGQVFAPTLVERTGRLFPIPQKQYYNINGAHNMRRISRRDLMALLRANPELMQEIIHGTKTPKLVDKLMRLAKLPFQLSDRGGVIP